VGENVIRGRFLDSKELNGISEELRKILQHTLKKFVRDATEGSKLAKILKKSQGHVQSMIYEGKGGLDVWTTALAHYYEINLGTLKNLRTTLKRLDPAYESDNVWFGIRDELGASEEDLFYLARCAHEAYAIKKELEGLKGKKKGRTRGGSKKHR